MAGSLASHNPTFYFFGKSDDWSVTTILLDHRDIEEGFVFQNMKVQLTIEQ